MIITNANRDDLVEFSQMEENVFGVDSFGLSLLEQYLYDNLLFQKIVDPADLTIIGFTIVAKRGETETSSKIVNEFLKKMTIILEKQKKLMRY